MTHISHFTNGLQRDVALFHATYGAPVADIPSRLSEDREDLRIGLIEEEFKELKEAIAAGDVVETYDAAIDIVYVTLGLLVEMGIDIQPGWDEVQRSNMSKLGADGRPIISRGLEEDGFPKGKVLKGPDYFRPNLRRVVDNQFRDASFRPIPTDPPSPEDGKMSLERAREIGLLD
jgi:predicted HAD superfamily Cof-like phosphohydrolase